MKFALFMALILAASFSFAGQALPELTVSQDAVGSLTKEIRRLKEKDLRQSYYADSTARTPEALMGHDCEPSRPICVRNCTSRFSDGSCAHYGPDFCGPRAKCSLNCTSRFSDGSCAHYAEDFCGPDAQCTPNCRSRFADGSCASYSEDVCY